MAKILFFGSSAISPFMFLKHPDYYVYKFSAASAKGLGKSDNQNRLKIIEAVSSHKPNCVVFNFGTVDLAFVIYYKIFVQHEFVNIHEFFDKIAEDYVDLVASLPVDNKYIISPPYSPIEDKYVLTSLKSYDIIPQDFKLDKEYLPLISRKTRNEFVDTFINSLKKYCDRNHIDFINSNKFMAKNGKILDKYLPLTETTVHYNWEAQIIDYIRLIKKCKLNPKHLVDLEKTKQEFIAWKTEKLKQRKFSPRKKD